MIRLTCTEFEVNAPELGNYLHCRVDVEDQGFVGWCKCMISEPGWDAFLRDLADVAEVATSPASIVAGWGEETYFRLQFEPQDRRGHVWVSGEVGMPVRARVDLNPPVSHRLDFAYEIDLATLDRFIADARGFKATGQVVEVVGLPT